MLEKLLTYDKILFLFINRTTENLVFDFTMPLIREAAIWIPLYLGVLILLYKKTGWKNMMLALALIGIMVGIGDSVITERFKYHFERLRPCYAPELNGLMKLRLDSCGGKFGFFSAHAFNHFALAIFFNGTIPQLKKRYKVLFILWALLIGYGQIYVGKHYPLDIACGAFMGMLTSGLILRLQKMIVNKFSAVLGENGSSLG